MACDSDHRRYDCLWSIPTQLDDGFINMWARFRSLLYTLSYAFSTIVVVAFWLNYKNYNSPRFDLDTNYLWWITTLPAISVCQTDGFNSLSLNPTTEEIGFIRNLVRPGKSLCKACNSTSYVDYNRDYRKLVSEIVASCENLFSQCSWNGKLFDCCQRFGQLWTRKGICYSVNSDMTKDILSRFSVSHFSKDAEMDLSVNHPIQVYIHDPKDVAFMKRKMPVVGFGSSLKVSYSTKEILVDQSAWDLTFAQRGCVLPGEKATVGFPKYSKSACKAECLARHQIKVCGCYYHLLPEIGNKRVCDAKGLECLDANFLCDCVYVANKETRRKTVRECGCAPTCDETEVKIVWRKMSRNSNTSVMHVNLQLTKPPTERLILKARVNLLDSIVGFACFTRLFTSSSLLGVVSSALHRILPHRPMLSYRQLLY